MLYHEMLISTEIWTNNFQTDLKKCFRQLLRFSDIGKKLFLKVIFKKRPLSRNDNIFVHMNKKKVFTEF